jgi:Rnl2 family RNA ligase
MERQPFEFRGYTSINNVDDNSQATKMNEENFFNSDIEWIFTEKVHGSNFQFTTDGERIQCSKRTSILQPGESFFNWESTRDKEQGKILNLFKSIQEYFNDYSINEIIVFGELFGGTYLHPDVPKIANVKHIQKGTLVNG